MGRFIHVPPSDPVSNWVNDFGLPWWKDDQQFCIGGLSRKTRHIRVVNTLTKDEHLLEVGSEETLLEIQDRYFDYNSHAASYTWKVRRCHCRWSHGPFVCSFLSLSCVSVAVRRLSRSRVGGGDWIDRAGCWHVGELC
jgi:hypothetical protein